LQNFRQDNKVELKKLIKTTKVVKFVDKNMKRSQALFVTTFKHHSYEFIMKNIQGVSEFSFFSETDFVFLQQRLAGYQNMGLTR